MPSGGSRVSRVLGIQTANAKPIRNIPDGLFMWFVLVYGGAKAQFTKG